MAVSRTLLAFVCILSSIAFAVGAGSDVVILTPDNFDSYVGGDKAVFVEFYAPWCGHCKNLAPEYEIVGTAFVGKPVVVASVDADKYRDLGSRFSVTGFPTLKFFPARSTEAEAYSGGRTAADIIDFINTKTGAGGRIKSVASDVITLTPSNFDEIVLNPKYDVLVEFYAPWCGHCKALAPEYEKLGTAYKNDANVLIAKVDADQHRELGSRYGVEGFPTIKFFPKNNKNGVDYPAGRNLQDFIKYLNLESGSERAPGGGYTPYAGRIPSLDLLAAQLGSASDDTRASIVNTIDNAVNTDEEIKNDKNANFAKFYSIVANKMLTQPDFANSEYNRLSRMLEKGGVNAKNLELFYKRMNIAKAFIPVTE